MIKKRSDLLITFHYDIMELSNNDFLDLGVVSVPRNKIEVNEGDLIGYQFDMVFNINNKLKEALEMHSKYFILSFGESSYICTCLERKFKTATIEIICPVFKSNDDKWVIKVYRFSNENFLEIKNLLDKLASVLSSKVENVIEVTKITTIRDSITTEYNGPNFSFFSFWFSYMVLTTREWRSQVSYEYFSSPSIMAEVAEEIKRYLSSAIMRVSSIEKSANAIIEKNIVERSDVLSELKTKFEEIKESISAETRATFVKELEKLRYMNPMSPDYSGQIEYLSTVISIPWGQYNGKDVAIDLISEKLNSSHYGLDIAKTSIIEHLALQQWTGETYGEIICLIGPPGTGKSSIANTIANSLGRKFIKMALGGLGDESELRGHRKTYVSAAPGRLVKELIKIESLNPVIVLDEIDKLQTHKGSPADALLEILDPEQNDHFVDRYLGFSLDISKCLFICTANYKDQIPAALLNRMSVIDLEGYTEEEQQKIAKDYLLPKYQKRWNLDCVTVEESLIYSLCQKKKTGMRDIEREIQKILKKSTYTMISQQLRELAITKENCKEVIKYILPITTPRNQIGYRS